jgi:hypothetical protein
MIEEAGYIGGGGSSRSINSVNLVRGSREEVEAAGVLVVIDNFVLQCSSNSSGSNVVHRTGSKAQKASARTEHTASSYSYTAGGR